MKEEQRWKALYPIRGREYWQIEIQPESQQAFAPLPEEYPNRRKARNAAKRLVAAFPKPVWGGGKSCRLVRVIETRFSEPMKDRVYLGLDGKVSNHYD